MGQPSDRTVIPPERRPDGTFRYALQVIVSEHGKWETGHAHFELVGWASDLEHVKKLQGCLL